jgi:hypothetical protein
MSNKDKELINSIISGMNPTTRKVLTKGTTEIEFPLDAEIITCLQEIYASLRMGDDDYEIYNHLESIKKLWKSIISKSIKCLRYFDKREPFLANSNKKPVAYGINDLFEYFKKYIDFETTLYGNDKYYRDHVIHVFRTWLLGINCLLRNDGELLGVINIDSDAKVNEFEKVSIWSIVALTHDLGYPLEKARKIIDKTQGMMSSFVANPNISMDLSFSGVQNNMNDFIVRFLSSKMKSLNLKENESKKPESEKAELKTPQPEETGLNKPEDPEGKFVARLQPKYFFKFQKSLEKSDHGIISSIIIYKILNYFLESDFNINEDYDFNREEVRQFYIRREILRSIASHTCKDIYHLYMSSFSFLLIIMDDCQEWGRKRISEMYVKSSTGYELSNIDFKFKTEGGRNDSYCTVSEKFTFSKEDESALVFLLNRLRKQCLDYMEIFRDGQDTEKRDFTYMKKCEIDIKCKMNIEFKIHRSEAATFKIRVDYTGDALQDCKFNKKFFLKTFDIDDSKLIDTEVGVPGESKTEFTFVSLE